MNAGEFGNALQSLDPCNADFEASIEQLVGGVDPSDRLGLIDQTFNFFEAHPVEDLGSPGGLVHFVEQFYPEYKARLLFSLRRAPSLSFVWMTNRILNTKLGDAERAGYFAALEGVTTNPAIDARIRTFAERFVDLQRAKSDKISMVRLRPIADILWVTSDHKLAETATLWVSA